MIALLLVPVLPLLKLRMGAHRGQPQRLLLFQVLQILSILLTVWMPTIAQWEGILHLSIERGMEVQPGLTKDLEPQT